MRRRRLLALAGATGAAALAGCTGPGDDERPSDALAFAVDDASAATADAPARLALRVANESVRDVAATGVQGPVLPFGARFGSTPGGAARLLAHPDGVADLWFRVDSNDLVPSEEVLPAAPEGGCWRIPSEHDGIADPPTPTTRDLPAGGAVAHAYALYHLHDCTPGAYTFSQAVTLATVADEGEVDEREGAVPLRLRVTVNADGGVDVEQFGIADGYPE